MDISSKEMVKDIERPLIRNNYLAIKFLFRFFYMYHTFTALMKAFGFDSKYAETNVKIPSFIINFCSRQIPFPSLPSNNKIIRKACRHAAALLSPQTLSV